MSIFDPISEDPPSFYRWVKIKYTRLMSHNTASIASVVKIRLGLDLRLDYDTIKVHFTSSSGKLLTHKPTASSENLQKLVKNRVSNPMKNFSI